MMCQQERLKSTGLRCSAHCERHYSLALCIEKYSWVCCIQHASPEFRVATHNLKRLLFIPSFISTSCSCHSSNCELDISQILCFGSSSSASIMSILLLVPHLLLYQPHDSKGWWAAPLGRASSASSLSCAPRCGPFAHSLSSGNYTHLKPITTSKRAGTGKWSRVFPLMPYSILLWCTCSYFQEIINNGKFIRLATNSI